MDQPTAAEFRGPIAWMAANPVAANLLMVVLLVGGLIWSTRIRQDVYPDYESDTVTVSVDYPGASPEEVEQGIILAVEEAVQGLDGVDEVSSTAQEGSGTVNILALAGADIQALAQDVQSEIDRITSFPEEAEEPRVKVSTRRRYVISLVVHGRLDERLLRQTAEEIRDGLLQEPGITQVDLAGTRPLEIAIEVPLAKLRAYGLTLGQVSQRVRDAAVEMGGGGLKTEAGEILVRMKERRDWGREFARIPIITAPDGTQVRLEDLARIHDGLEDSDYFATFEGQPAVMVEVYRVGDQTPIAVSKAARRYLERLGPNLPPGLAVAVRNDRSEVYGQRLKLLLSNGAFGLMLVFLLLGVFLEARLAFWVAMGIPISFLGSLLILPAADVTINMMSMFAFIIALGIVVDDAIVVGENVYHYRQAGLAPLAAAVRGAREVATPVTFSILTNVAAFLPLAFVPGWMGKVFLAIPVVVITVFLISLVESVFILPAHLGHLRERHPGGLRGRLHRRQQRFSYYFMGFVRERFGPFLDACLRQRYLTVALGLTLLLLVLGYVKSGRMGMVLFPRVESDFAFAKAQLPYGSAVARTEAVRDRLIATAREIAAAYPGIKVLEGIYGEIGPSHITQVRVYLPPPDARPVPTAEFIRQWRERTGELPGLEGLVFQSDSGGPGSGAALTVELTHPRLEVLEQAGADLARSLADFPIVRDIDDGFAPGKQQLDFTIRPEGRALGLTAREVARQVRNAFYGAEALRQQRGRNEIRVMVRLPEADRRSEYTLEELVLRAPNGAEVPLREAVEIQRGRSYTEIKRRQGRRVINVTADVDPPSQADWVAKALEAEALPALAARYPGLRYGFEGRQAETADSLRSLFLGLALAVLAMYGMLAVPFRSYLQPAIIMVSIPYGIVGAVLGHMLMGYSLSVMSMFGIVALSGVVVNDALVLIEFANRVYRQGGSAREAMLVAAVQRFRPVLLTTLTTFGGLAPMIFETSRQARFMIPMAISLGFGVLFATVITLLLVPCLFVIVEDARRLVHPPPQTDAASLTASGVEPPSALTEPPPPDPDATDR